MNEEQLKALQAKLETAFDTVMEQKLKDVVGPMVASETKSIVEKMRLDRALTGKDRSGLSDDQKMAFAEHVKSVAMGQKTVTGQVPDTAGNGGALVPVEVASAISRIAASVGLVMSQATKWDMSSAYELDVPNYTGAFLEGAYNDYDTAATITTLSAFGKTQLVTKRWTLAFAVSKGLLRTATVNLADWLLALAAESLNNMIDKQAFVGDGNPFTGITNVPDNLTNVITLASGQNTFAEFKVLDDASDMIGTLEESLLPGAAFYMNRTVWAKLRVQKDGTTGNYILPMAGAASNGVLANNPTGGGVKLAGEILGFPVFTVRHLPGTSTADQASTKFIVFGNFSAAAFGDTGKLSVEEHRSGTFGGKEIALAGQRAMVFEHEHAFGITIPKAFVIAKTAAS